MDKIEATMAEKIDNAITVAKNVLPAVKDDFANVQRCGQSILNLRMTKALYASLVNPSEELDTEISLVLKKVRGNLSGVDMQQVTQAALHLMQAKAMGEESQQGKTTKKQLAGA
jgi:hypothetical protein